MHRWQVKGWEKIFHEKGNKTTGVAIFTSDKIDIQTKAIRDKKRHCIMIKGSLQEDITLVNTNTPNIGGPK